MIGVASFSAIKYIKDRKKVDDVLDVSSVHGVSGIVGTIAIGILATTMVNPNGPTGLLYGGNVMQIGIQVIGGTFCSSTFLCWNLYHFEDHR